MAPAEGDGSFGSAEGTNRKFSLVQRAHAGNCVGPLALFSPSLVRPLSDELFCAYIRSHSIDLNPFRKWPGFSGS